MIKNRLITRNFTSIPFYISLSVIKRFVADKPTKIAKDIAKKAKPPLKDQVSQKPGLLTPRSWLKVKQNQVPNQPPPPKDPSLLDSQQKSPQKSKEFDSIQNRYSHIPSGFYTPYNWFKKVIYGQSQTTSKSGLTQSTSSTSTSESQTSVNNQTQSTQNPQLDNIPTPPPLPTPKIKDFKTKWLQDLTGKWIKSTVHNHNNSTSSTPNPSSQPSSTQSSSLTGQLSAEATQNIPPHISLAFTEELKTVTQPIEPGESTNNPSQIFSNINGIAYKTYLNQQSDISNVRDYDLIVELQNRMLIKDDSTPEVSVKLESGDSHTFTNPGFKLTPLGYAYHSQLNGPSEVLYSNLPSDSNNIQFQVIIVDSNANNSFLHTGKQKHMLAAYNANTDEYRVMGYFTSKKTANFFSSERFKVFQSKLENTPTSSSKTQYFFAFDNAERILSKDIKIVKYGTEYIKTCNKIEYFDELSKKLEKQPYKQFNTEGISKEECIKMCLQHDANVKTDKSHPLTEDQIKLNLENQAKIHATNEEKKKAKLLSKQNDNENKEIN